MNTVGSRLTDNNFAKALLGEQDKFDEDSAISNKDATEQESMFGNDENKKTGKPIKGRRWMAFTFLMIIILCVIVMFHDEFEKAKSGAVDYIGKQSRKLAHEMTGDDKERRREVLKKLKAACDTVEAQKVKDDKALEEPTGYVADKCDITGDMVNDQIEKEDQQAAEEKAKEQAKTAQDQAQTQKDQDAREAKLKKEEEEFAKRQAEAKANNEGGSGDEDETEEVEGDKESEDNSSVDGSEDKSENQGDQDSQENSDDSQ